MGLKMPALTAVWSKAPLLTARCLSPLLGFESRPGHVRKLPVTWGKAVFFTGYSGFLHYLQLASHELATIGINVTKNKIPTFQNENAPKIHEIILEIPGSVASDWASESAE